MVHTCPRCELRFMHDKELKHHLEVDHHVDPGSFERFHYKAPGERPAGRRYLVVANQTLNEALLERIKQLSAARQSHFHLVAPATHSEGHPAAPTTDDRGLALATHRIRTFVDRLHEAGVEAEGEVGDPEPVKAVARALEHEQADEIIVSTRPAGISRWLEVDLPKHLEHTFHLPVTVVTTGS